METIPTDTEDRLPPILIGDVPFSVEKAGELIFEIDIALSDLNKLVDGKNQNEIKAIKEPDILGIISDPSVRFALTTKFTSILDGLSAQGGLSDRQKEKIETYVYEHERVQRLVSPLVVSAVNRRKGQ